MMAQIYGISLQNGLFKKIWQDEMTVFQLGDAIVSYYNIERSCSNE